MGVIMKELIEYTNDKVRQPFTHHNENIRIWEKGYRKGIEDVRREICRLLKKEKLKNELLEKIKKNKQ